MPIEYTRTENRQWLSTCKRYRIEAQGIEPHFIYSAAYEVAPGKWNRLGKIRRGNAQDSANAAKDACETHAKLQPSFGEVAAP